MFNFANHKETSKRNSHICWQIYALVTQFYDHMQKSRSFVNLKKATRNTIMNETFACSFLFDWPFFSVVVVVIHCNWNICLADVTPTSNDCERNDFSSNSKHDFSILSLEDWTLQRLYLSQKILKSYETFRVPGTQPIMSFECHVFVWWK